MHKGEMCYQDNQTMRCRSGEQANNKETFITGHEETTNRRIEKILVCWGGYHNERKSRLISAILAGRNTPFLEKTHDHRRETGAPPRSELCAGWEFFSIVSSLHIAGQVLNDRDSGQGGGLSPKNTGAKA